jgi:hypothetical protein
MNREDPYCALSGAYTRTETVDVTRKHIVSGCPPALPIDGEAGIRKTTIGAARRCLLRGLACRPLASGSARFFAGPADLLDGIPKDPR